MAIYGNIVRAKPHVFRHGRRPFHSTPVLPSFLHTLVALVALFHPFATWNTPGVLAMDTSVVNAVMLPIVAAANYETFHANFLRLADRWSNETGISINAWWPKPEVYSTEDFARFFRIIAQQQSRHWDLIALDVIWPAAFAQSSSTPGLLLPIDGIVSPASLARHDPRALASGTVNGSLYALPAYADGGALFYRSDLLAKYGFAQPPKTWDHMEGMLVRILAGERATDPSLAGFVTQMRPYEGLTCNVVEWLAGANLTTFLDASMNLTLATKTEQEQVADVLGRFRRWVNAGLIPTASLLYSDMECARLFLQGNAVFVRMWGSGGVYLRNGAPSNLSWGFAPLPGESADLAGASTLGGGMVAVNRFASNVTRAALVAEFLSGPEVQRLVTTGLGFRPTIPSLFRDAAVNRVYDTAFLNSAQITNRPAASSKDQYLAVSTMIYTGVNLILGGFADALATIASINTAIANLLAIDHFGPPQVVVWNDVDGISAITIVSFLILVISALAVYLLHSRDAARKRRLPTEFLVGVLVGSLVGSLTPLAYIGTPTSISCQLRVTLLSMGFIVTVSCMAAQDFRVFLIISSPLRRVASDVNRVLWQSLVAVWVLEAILLGVWLGLDPLVPVDVIVGDAWRYTGCVSKNRTFSGGMFAVQCLLCVSLVLLCVWLAVHNRGVSKTNTSGGAMSRASYLLAICSSSAIGALSVLNLAPGPYLLTMTVTIALCILSVLWAYVLAQLTAPPAVEDSSWMGTTIHAASDSVDDGGVPNDLNVATQSTRAIETKLLAIRFGHTERALLLSPWMAGARVVLVPDAGMLIVRYSQRHLVLSLRKLVSVSPYEPKTHSFTATFAAGILEVHARSETDISEWHARLDSSVAGLGQASARPTRVATYSGGEGSKGMPAQFESIGGTMRTQD